MTNTCATPSRSSSTAVFNGMKRPGLLSRAARAGARLYRRERDLKAVLPGMTGKRRAIDIVNRLCALEATHEQERREGSVTYSVARHVAVLTALVAEGERLASV